MFRMSGSNDYQNENSNLDPILKQEGFNAFNLKSVSFNEAVTEYEAEWSQESSSEEEYQSSAEDELEYDFFIAPRTHSMPQFFDPMPEEFHQTYLPIEPLYSEYYQMPVERSTEDDHVSLPLKSGPEPTLENHLPDQHNQESLQFSESDYQYHNQQGYQSYEQQEYQFYEQQQEYQFYEQQQEYQSNEQQQEYQTYEQQQEYQSNEQQQEYQTYEQQQEYQTYEQQQYEQQQDYQFHDYPSEDLVQRSLSFTEPISPKPVHAQGFSYPEYNTAHLTPIENVVDRLEKMASIESLRESAGTAQAYTELYYQENHQDECGSIQNSDDFEYQVIDSGSCKESLQTLSYPTETHSKNLMISVKSYAEFYPPGRNEDVEDVDFPSALPIVNDDDSVLDHLDFVVSYDLENLSLQHSETESNMSTLNPPEPAFMDIYTPHRKSAYLNSKPLPALPESKHFPAPMIGQAISSFWAKIPPRHSSLLFSPGLVRI